VASCAAMDTLGEGGNREVIRNYIANQGIKNPHQLLKLFNF
jgi:hypothetical protein